MRIVADTPFDPDLSPRVRYRRELQAFRRRQQAKLRAAAAEFHTAMTHYDALLKNGGRRKKAKETPDHA
jgi:hypothetical protein